MKAFIPEVVTDEMLVSSSIPEPSSNEPLYNSGSTYAEFDLVSVISENSHLVYESLISGNIRNNPVTTDTEAMPNDPKWIKKSYTNRFKMFDMNQGDPSVATSPLTVIIRPGKRISSLGLDIIKATEVDITITDGDGTEPIYTLDGYLLNRQGIGWYDFLYEDFLYDTKVVTFAIPPISDPVIKLVLTDPSGVIELSRFGFGMDCHLGTIQWNPVSDSDNYSEIEWNRFGRATLTPIPSIPLTEQKLTVNREQINVVRKFRELANGKAVFWSGLDDREYEYTESLIIVGVYRKFSLDIPNPSYAVANLSIKGI